jgi:hypothetical protein
MDDSLEPAQDERRCEERRTSRSYVFRDKRTGFDRRAAPDYATARGFVHHLLIALRDSSRTLMVVLLTVNVLNLVDFALTLNALAIGATEANPVMASLFEASPVWAGIFKMAAVALASLLVWEWRRYRKALLAAMTMLAVFTAVFVYHIVGLALFR